MSKRAENNKKTKNSESFEVLKKLLKSMGKYKFLIALSVVLAAVCVVLQLYVPILFGNAIDKIVEKNSVNFKEAGAFLQKVLIFVVLSSVITWIMNVINNKAAYSIVNSLRFKATNRIMKLPLSYLDKRSTGDVLSCIIADADILSDGLVLGFTQLFSGIATIILTLVFMFSKNIPITIMVVLLTPLSFFAAKFISSRSYKMFKLQSEIRAEQTAFADEIIGNQKVVKAFGVEDDLSDRFSKINEKLKNYSLKAVFYSSLTNPATRFVNNIIYALVALFGALIIPKGLLTVGGLSALLAYANQFMKPFNDISSVVTEMQNALACASRIFALIEEKEEKGGEDKILPKVNGNVDFDNVFFSYDKSKSLIEDFNLSAKEGMRIAVVGPTGCGKTTLINLIMRFYEVDKGAITIDGVNINDVTKHSLRKNIGMVLQDTWIKEGTVRENIAIAKPDATDEEIIDAAKRAHSYEFIEKMGQGLDTYLTGESLSQGQKQLLCITRVMLCMPPMLILDEATSNIDTRTEMMVQKAFDALMEGRTSFVVAHRLSTIRNASLILVMKDGKIIEKGNHKELIKKGGFYKKLYESQFAKV